MPQKQICLTVSRNCTHHLTIQITFIIQLTEINTPALLMVIMLSLTDLELKVLRIQCKVCLTKSASCWMAPTSYGHLLAN